MGAIKVEMKVGWKLGGYHYINWMIGYQLTMLAMSKSTGDITHQKKYQRKDVSMATIRNHFILEPEVKILETFI